MPFRSKSQMRLLYAKHPEVAKRWSKKYGQPKNLPEHVSRKPKSKQRLRKLAKATS
jgi:hypothetical protein